jgi:outer membrane protein OmpA-like peptidoglycan-associated protein
MHFKTELGQKDTLTWIGEVRRMNLPGLSCMEHLEIAETMSGLRNTLEFEFGSMDIAVASEPALNRFGSILKIHTCLSVRIEGHCGIEAPDHVAVQFSERRAQSVSQALVDRGIASRRVSFQGFGKSRALVPASGAMNQQAGGDRNRRVEVYLVHEGLEFPFRPELKEVSGSLQRRDSARGADGLRARVACSSSSHCGVTWAHARAPPPL